VGSLQSFAIAKKVVSVVTASKGLRLPFESGHYNGNHGLAFCSFPYLNGIVVGGAAYVSPCKAEGRCACYYSISVM
jgi:hypothetical protein